MTRHLSRCRMLFNSWLFVAFFLVVYPVYRALDRSKQNGLLLIASYVFYAAWDWRFLSLIALSTAIDYACGLRIPAASTSARKRAWLLLSLTVNLGLLAIFKYCGFFVDSFHALAGALGTDVTSRTWEIVLPVGISFYTFQTLSYTIDVYRGVLRPERNLLTFALYVAYFPQLVAGPIERARQLLPQFREPRTITRDHIMHGAWLIAWGYFLKVYMADNLARFVDDAFNHLEHIGGLEALAAVYAFAFQIFGDFAGYSCIAIGISKLMGIHLMENFRFPYFVTNPSDFWRHWHISLSSWLRDYLYVPLGGNRGSPRKTGRNLMVTMLLGGIWHGAAWTFVWWGAYHGALLGLHRLLRHRLARIRFRGFHWICGIVMFHLTCAGWLLFRAQGMEQVGYWCEAVFKRWSVAPENGWIVLRHLALYAGPVVCIQALQARRGEANRITALPRPLRLAIIAVMYLLFLCLGEFGRRTFIYFQF